MRSTLKLFTNNSSLQASSESLLEKLGIKYTAILRGVPLDDYFKLSGFNYQYVKDLEQSLEHIWNIGYVNNTTFEGSEASDQNAKYPGLYIFACEIKPEVSFTRSMAVALTRAFNRASTQRVNNSYDMPVIVIIRQGSMLSLATCERSDRQDGHGEKVGRVTILRDMNCCNLHAGHKQILDRIKENVRGCGSYEELHRKWFESFNIDILSDNFFMGYKNIYEDIIEYITGKRMVKESSKWVEHDNKKPNVEIMAEFAIFEDPEKAVRDYVKKLLGRLVFIQFLQKKGWMGVPTGESWIGGDPDFLQNLFRASPYKDDFVDMVLEPLFKDLNTPRDNDLVSDSNVHHRNQIKVPYLNGGLFEVSSSDSLRFKIPGKFFWNDDEGEAEKHPGILRLFSNYNFTIDENAPDDVEIGVDPEMLSRIFENLLEDNKEKGAFYTPKEIVRYMCQESLIAYLDTNTSIASEKIRKFVISPEEGILEIPENKRGKLKDALKNVKICDPAIGSGAFPMGMLNELLHCREILNGDSNSRTEIKKSIIRDNLYGVDIEKGAVDIARLRFWLSIVVDEEIPSPMPNLDYKIMQGNSLIESFEGIDLSKLTYEIEDEKDKGEVSLFDDEKNILQKNVSQLLVSYYSCSGHDRKVELQQKISNTINKQLESQGYDSAILAQLKEINLAENNTFFLWHTWFSDVFRTVNGKGGFDIVIGNPPYMFLSGKGSPVRRLERIGKHDEAVKMQLLFDLYTRAYPEVSDGCKDFYKWFYKLAINICAKSGVLAYITPDTFFNMPRYKDLRTEIFKHKVIRLADLGFSVFDAPTVSSAICIMKKDFSESKTTTISDVRSDLTRANRADISHIVIGHSNIVHIQDNELNAFKHVIAERIYGSEKYKNIGESVSFVEGEHRIQIDKSLLTYSPAPNSVPVLIDSDMVRNGYVEKGYIPTTYTATNNLHCGERGILRKTGDTIFVSVPRDSEYAVAHQNVYVVKDKGTDKDKISIYFWMGLLNSQLLSFLYQNGLYGQKGRTMAQFRIYALNVLPLPKKIDSQLIDEIQGLSEKLVKTNDEHERTKIESEIDQRVYKMYDLSKDDITEIKTIMSR